METAQPFVRPGTRRLWWFYAIAAATFLPALRFHYVGEEAIYTISSLEMWHRHEWVQQLLYGSTLKRNPLYNWLIIPLASIVGWEHVLAVARAIAIAATVGAGLVLAWLARALYGERAFAALAALVSLTIADVFFYRGWLAYTDPLFAFFVFAALAALWVACLRGSLALLATALFALTCAFMTKTLTAYAFYGVTAVVLLAAERRYREFLLRPASWLLHAAAAALALAWLYSLPENTGQGGRLVNEVLAKLAPEDLARYAAKLALYPLEIAVRLGPALLVAVYYWRRSQAQLGGDPHMRVAVWVALLNFAPYWLAPQSASRYLLPLYPVAALLIARALWVAGPHAIAVAQRWLVAVLAVKLALVIAVFPYYQERYRGAGYAVVARQIVERTAGHPLYANNVSASGLSVAAHIDVLRLPGPPLVFPPARWASGFVMSYAPDPALGKVAERYRLGGNELYLLCRGAACMPGN